MVTPNAILACLLCIPPGDGATSVWLSLGSPEGLLLRRPGAAVTWEIAIDSPAASSSGLASFSVDLAQSPSNPVLVDIPPGDTIPAVMASFSRPLGICNPAPGQPPNSPLSGYLGTPVGPAGQKNLVQIGGMLNTFGGTGGQSVFGQDFDVTNNQGVGVGSPIVVASGWFRAPAGTPGQAYSFSLQNGRANVLLAVHSPPLASTVVVGSVVLSGGISFTLTCPADLDDGSMTGTPDGGVDINDLTFLLTGYEAGDPAVDLDDGSGLGVPDGAVDINDLLFFLTHYEGGC